MVDLSQKEVQTNPCYSCPFAGEKPVKLSQARTDYIYKQLLTLKSQHLCHSTNNKKICRGGRDLQLKLLCFKGYLEDPTDEAFNQATKDAVNKNQK